VGTTGLDVVAKRKGPYPCRESNPGRLARSSVTILTELSIVPHLPSMPVYILPVRGNFSENRPITWNCCCIYAHVIFSETLFLETSERLHEVSIFARNRQFLLFNNLTP
jgi:hypothetical protein